MQTYSLGILTLAELGDLVEIHDRGMEQHLWDERERGDLADKEKNFLSVLHEHLLSQKAHLLNKATIWARAIYPLLALAERDNIRAYAEVPLSAVLSRGELRGSVDGALTSERPVMTTVASREYTERTEAASILLLLKTLVAEQLGDRG